jgi:hypothetical protein
MNNHPVPPIDPDDARPSVIDSTLVWMLEHFKKTDWCLLAASQTEDATKVLPRGQLTLEQALKALHLGFFRLEGGGHVQEADHAPQPVQVSALLVFNSLMGSGGTTPGFKAKMLDLARTKCRTYLLYRLASGPVALVEVMTGKTIKLFKTVPEAMACYYSSLAGNGFQLASLGRWIDTQKGSRWMAGVWAGACGEMQSVVDFTPLPFDENLENLTNSLREAKVEIGLVRAIKSETKGKLAELKQDAEAMGMTWHELSLFQDRPNTPEHNLPFGPPVLLVHQKDRRVELRNNLLELAVKQRQDLILFVYGDGAIELIEPFHAVVKQTFTDLHAGVRAYAATLVYNSLFPLVEGRIVASNQPGPQSPESPRWT